MKRKRKKQMLDVRGEALGPMKEGFPQDENTGTVGEVERRYLTLQIVPS